MRATPGARRLGKNQSERLELLPSLCGQICGEAIRTGKPGQSCLEAIGLVLRGHETCNSGWVNLNLGTEILGVAD